MDTNPVGSSDLKVSRIGLGTSMWGLTVDEHTAAEQLKIFIEAGGNLLDTADVYGLGAAEGIIGRLLGKVVSRDSIVLATKAGGSLAGPSAPPDASRAHLMAALNNSLRELHTDYIDLWQIHRWDFEHPLDEALSAIDWALSSGRVRHAGVSNYCGWQTMKAAICQAAGGRQPLVCTQVEYSLLERGIEREVVPAAIDQGLSIIAWAPLGRGVLTGKYRQGVPEDRASSIFFQQYVGPYLDERSSRIVDSVVGVAERLGVAPVDVAVAWVLTRPAVSAAVVGASRAAQLEESLTSSSLTLPADAIQLLNSVSAPYIGAPETSWAVPEG